MRIAPWAGFGFVVTFLVSLVVGTAPDIHDTRVETLAYYGTDAHKTKAFVAWALAGVSALLLVCFVAGVVQHLRAGGPAANDGTETAVTISAAALVALVVVAGAVRAAPVGDLVMDDEKRPGDAGKLTETFADFARFTVSAYDWLTFFGVGLAAAALVLAVSLSARRTATFPRWLCLAGYVAVPVLALVAWFNLILMLLWVFVVSVLLVRRRHCAPGETVAKRARAASRRPFAPGSQR